MSGEALDSDRLARMHDVMAGHVERGEVPGLVWLVARRGEVHVGLAGARDADGRDQVGRDSIFRIASMTKPVTAVAALILIEECRLRLDEPVDRWLPELADRRVLRVSDGALDDTVPARRPITLRDLLTFRMGLGMDFAATGPQPVLAAMAQLGLGVGAPAPAGPPEPNEWMRRLGTLPLAHQPGERWLYHTSADVPATGSCTTRPTASGAARPPSPPVAPGWCPRSTTTWPSPRCSGPAAPTAASASSPARQSKL